MSGILRRTIMIDRSKGYVIPHDWALATTGLGVCAEPFVPFARLGGEFSFEPTNDPTDQIRKVDDIMEVSIGKEISILSFGGESNLHGGSLAPRTGY